MTHLWLLLFLNSWLTSETQGFGINLIKVPDDDRAQIICTAALLGKYFNSGEPLSGSVLDMSITSAVTHVQQALLHALHTNENYPWTIVVKETRRDYDTSTTTSEFVMHEKPQCYFIILENMEDEDMDDIFENWKTNLNWNPLAQFVVFLSAVEETEEEMTDIMIEILLNFMNKKIYNVNVIGQSEESSCYYGKTVFPYHPDNNCGNRVISIETLDICDYQESEKENEEGEEGEEDTEDEEVYEEDGEVVREESKEERDEEREDMENISLETTDDKNIENSQENNEISTTISYTTAFTDIDGISTRTPDLQTTAPSQEDLIDETSITDNYSLQSTTSSQVELIDETITSITENYPLESTTSLQLESTTTSQEYLKDETTTNITVNYPRQPTTSSQVEWLDNTSISIIENNSLQSTITLQVYLIDETSENYLLQSTTSSDVEYIDDSNNSEMDYKYLPLTENITQSIYPKLHIKEIYRALFLDKFPKDLSGCPLVAAYRPWEPYIFSEALDDVEHTETPTNVESNSQTNDTSYGGEDNEDDNDDYTVYGEHPDMDSDSDAQTGSVEIRLNGIEYKMIQTIGERLHISIEMQVENSNLYHLFQQLIDGDIEMVVGGIDEDPSISQFVSSTIPYHQDDLTWCVAKAQHTHNLFNFLATFEISAWILTLIFILTASLNILMSRKYLGCRMDFLKSYFSINLYVMGIILSQSISLRPLPTCLKVCFGATFFMALMFSNVYQSFLVSTLTTPKSAYQISHLQEIYQNRMHIMGSVDNVRHLNKEGEIYRYVREQFQMCYNIEECLQRTAADAKLAVAVSRQHSFYNPRIPRDDLYCFDRNENIYVYLVTMLMPKKFHLLHKINPVIQHIIESGHMQKWARDLDMRRKISEEIQRAREEPFKSLTLAQVGGSFIFAGILWICSSVMFAMEHLTYWLVVKRKTRLKLAKLFHRKLV